MLVLDEARTRAALPWRPLIDAIDHMFKGGCMMPVRHHHTMAVPGESDATLLLMPAWVPGRYSGVKVLSLFPDNGLRGLPAIYGTYLLSSGTTGEMLAIVDGGELTARRTAATSALAASKLARADASELLVCGTGRLSLNLMQAHAEVRSLTRIHVWGRNSDTAERTAAEARIMGLPAIAVSDLEAAARTADVISCATLSSQPLIDGNWLKAGAHLDLVGGYKPDMREADDTAIRRASVFVDTLAGATHEAGDIVQPLASGVLTRDGIRAELAELARGEKPGRRDDNEITLFKSVGAALEDLAGAILAYESLKDELAA
ncbi:ornithine cyclodeaminase family protein [Rhizobium sp. VS19-DR104.2]|uniref:ornithine cyclodeaminase family protein n=1 Tax=unclassified Rhizobium TaxID=2613769 RepID=UPI001CC3451B|nr:MULTISPECIES: ornithine cyclodeaminase family protein [unclassified Rhizobium]MBZ5760543.1 ornithine cyclodeaminase family protein [Rhizobium sp. VS19-DR96]MBZ5765673.1 ornithine cyclodeaminase family protein [Rhizobium sp. VS19-DR129.2]MBZ5774592.1 ornithine cyclodeaminase family protein [Rhizobium sp. VS19-DRK62.2]MBZ5784378.1 ornithine cyclodeaminase family protein [Rhizobium sp. VS19-DR121]MBZ5800990.1 ornithine cyclodeaminase family protein [Rhizobium sp. VS19-DR181]